MAKKKAPKKVVATNETTRKWLRIEYRVQVDSDVSEEDVDTDFQNMIDENIGISDIKYHDHGSLFVTRDKPDVLG